MLQTYDFVPFLTTISTIMYNIDVAFLNTYTFAKRLDFHFKHTRNYFS
jgi:hypothetical protein